MVVGCDVLFVGDVMRTSEPSVRAGQLDTFNLITARQCNYIIFSMFYIIYYTVP